MLRRKLWNKMIALGLCISMAVGGNAAGFLTESMAYGSEFSDGEEQNQKESGEADPSPAEEPEEIDISDEEGPEDINEPEEADLSGQIQEAEDAPEDVQEVTDVPQEEESTDQDEQEYTEAEEFLDDPDLLETSNQPVDGIEDIIDVNNPECGIIYDIDTTGMTLDETYNDIFLDESSRYMSSMYYNGTWYQGNHGYLLYGWNDIEKKYEFLVAKEISQSTIRLLKQLEQYGDADKYSKYRMIIMPFYYNSYQKKYIPASILIKYKARWIDNMNYSVIDNMVFYEKKQVSDAGNGSPMPTMPDTWETNYSAPEDSVRLTDSDLRVVTQIQNIQSRKAVSYKESGLPDGSVMITNTGEKDVIIKAEVELTGKTEFVDNNGDCKIFNKSSEVRSCGLKGALYEKNEQGNWKEIENSRSSISLGSNERTLKPGDDYVVYAPVSVLYNYQVWIKPQVQEEELSIEYKELTEGNVWKQSGEKWTAVLSSDSELEESPILGIQAEEASLPTYKENGLPNYALLVRGAPNTGTVTGYDGVERYPGYFIRVNPCWDKNHNNQPNNYQNSALRAVCIYYKLNQETGKYELEEEYKRPGEHGSYTTDAIEIYTDTSDYVHCFYVDPEPDEVVAVIPLDCTVPVEFGYSSNKLADYLKKCSRNYCFQYQVFLNSTQDWKITGVTSLDGESTPYYSDDMVKGSWLTFGHDPADHKGTAGADLMVSVKEQTDGTVLEYGADGLPNIGLRLEVGDIPDTGLDGLLKVNISVPEAYKNGEAGMGYSTNEQYRGSDTYEWRYQITGRGGTRMLAAQYRLGDEEIYEEKEYQILNVSSEKKTGFDLSDLDLQKGDIICILPYSPEYTGSYVVRENSSYDRRNVYSNGYYRWGGLVLSEAQYGSSQKIRYFNFDYNVELSGNEENLMLTGQDDTQIQKEGQVFYGIKSVSDDGLSLQKAELSVKEDTREDKCGIGENGLPNYGIIVLPGVGEEELLLSSDHLGSGEYDYYIKEYYKKGEDGIYTPYSDTVTVYRAKKTGDRIKKVNEETDPSIVVVIRPILPSAALKNKSFTSDYYNGASYREFQQSDGLFEKTDSSGKILYPQNGTVKYRFWKYKMDSSYEDSGWVYSYYYLGSIKRWKDQNWESTEPVTYSTSRTPYGISGTLDLRDQKERNHVLQATDGGSTTLYSTDLSANGLPYEGLVIQNKNVGGTSDEMAEINVRLDMSELGTGGEPSLGRMHFWAWLYQKDENGVWHKADNKHDYGDWINLGVPGKGWGYWESGDLDADYGYTVHAHLKDNEAIVILPQYRLCDFSYTVSLNNSKDFDIITEKCQLPADVQLSGRQTYKGTVFQWPNQGNPATHLVLATSPKNTASGENDTASRLTDVRSLPVTLFDYDFGNWEGFELAKQSAQYRFRYDPVNVKNTPVNSIYNTVFPGIVKNQLGEDGLPVLNYTTPFSLFDQTQAATPVNGGTKTVYSNVGFDFVYDPASNEYSYQSSLNHAGYDAGTNKIYQYDKALGIDGWGSKGAGFLPFNSFQDEGVWGTADKGTEGIYLLDQMKTVDYHFGMSMEKDFLIPENGTVAVTDAQGTVNDRKDLVFSFSGDDDAWLFIDGQLVLDMGGIHEAVSGSINFTKGIYTVTSSVTGDVQTGSLSDIFAGYPKAIGAFDDSEWAAGTKHTFAFYYLERGGTLSDCAIKFNLPVFKEFSVTKTVEGKETDQKFDMVLELFEANGDPYKGSLYQVIDGTKTSIQTEEGTYSFSLKDKQTINFCVPQECMSYSVTEKNPEGCSVSWKSSDGLSGEGNATDKVSSTVNTEIINQYVAPPTATPVPTEKPRPTGKPQPTPDITETPQISATPGTAPQVTTPAQTVTPKPEKTPTATPVSEEKEPTDTPAPGQGGSSYRGGGYGGSSGGSSTETSSPKTGDTSDMALWQCLLLMAIAAILATGWKLQKRKINK